MDSWSEIKIIADDEAANFMMQIFVEESLLHSDYKIVCCFEDEVVGFIFGNIIKFELSKEEKTQLRRLNFKFIFNQKGKMRKRLRYVYSAIRTKQKVSNLCKDYDSELILFAFDKKHQGKGLGKKCSEIFLSKLQKTL